MESKKIVKSSILLVLVFISTFAVTFSSSFTEKPNLDAVTEVTNVTLYRWELMTFAELERDMAETREKLYPNETYNLTGYYEKGREQPLLFFPTQIETREILDRKYVEAKGSGNMSKIGGISNYSFLSQAYFTTEMIKPDKNMRMDNRIDNILADILVDSETIATAVVPAVSTQIYIEKSIENCTENVNNIPDKCLSKIFSGFEKFTKEIDLEEPKDYNYPNCSKYAIQKFVTKRNERFYKIYEHTSNPILRFWISSFIKNSEECLKKLKRENSICFKPKTLFLTVKSNEKVLSSYSPYLKCVNTKIKNITSKIGGY